MTDTPLAPEQVHAFAPTAQGVAGDSASPEAIRRLSHQLANPKLNVKTQRKALEKLKAALMAIRAGDFGLGARRALDALKLDETNGLAWHVLAICREKSGDLGQALMAYEAALKLAPNETDVAHDLGRLAQQMGYLEIAEKLLLKYLAADPGHIRGHQQSGLRPARPEALRRRGRGPCGPCSASSPSPRCCGTRSAR